MDWYWSSTLNPPSDCIRSAFMCSTRVRELWVQYMLPLPIIELLNIRVTRQKARRVYIGSASAATNFLRRPEVAALTHVHIQQRDDRWCIVDMVGKHGRVRTVPIHLQGCSMKGDPVRDTRSEERRVGKECRSRWSPY